MDTPKYHKWSDIFSMRVGDLISPKGDDYTLIQRIPGGWLYYTKEDTDNDTINHPPVFVPYIRMEDEQYVD
mgnify:CR=1 FL=1